MANGSIKVTVKPVMPPLRHPLRELGNLLAALLDEDQFVKAERLLLDGFARCETERQTLAREAHAWRTAARDALKPPQPLDPLDVEELWDAVNADPYVDEVHQAFARLVEKAHGIGGHKGPSARG